MLRNENMNAEFQFNGKMVFFVSGNFHKYNEVRSILSSFGIATAMLRIKGNEIQSDNANEIASESAIEAFKRCHLPLIVEDAGLYIDSLKGFPGPYAAHVYKTIGNKGILKLMENVKNRKATFRSSIAYCAQDSDLMIFEGESKGKITLSERVGDGKAGFGFDPIFAPEHSRKTFAEMNIEEKNKFSHRASAISKFAEWYKNI